MRDVLRGAHAIWNIHGFHFALWTIYYSPADLPDRYVVRLFDLQTATRQFAIADSLEAARAEIPPGLEMLARHPDDEPQIVETWF